MGRLFSIVVTAFVLSGAPSPGGVPEIRPLEKDVILQSPGDKKVMYCKYCQIETPHVYKQEGVWVCKICGMPWEGKK